MRIMMMVVVSLFVNGCAPEVIIERTDPVLVGDAGVHDATTNEVDAAQIDVVSYCEVDTYHWSCYLHDNEIGVCISPGVCTWTCAVAADCPPWECHEVECDDDACVYPMSSNGTKCSTGLCMNGSCQ